MTVDVWLTTVPETLALPAWRLTTLARQSPRTVHVNRRRRYLRRIDGGGMTIVCLVVFPTVRIGVPGMCGRHRSHRRTGTLISRPWMGKRISRHARARTHACRREFRVRPHASCTYPCLRTTTPQPITRVAATADNNLVKWSDELLFQKLRVLISLCLLATWHVQISTTEVDRYIIIIILL